jgi:Putative prokaryotic signal transducing protein
MPKSPSLRESRESIAHGGDGTRGPGDDGDGGGGGGGGGDGKLVKVAFAPSQMEAEMIQGLLSEHGIPSLVKRGPGFDVPEFMPVGPRQVFVAESAAKQAREVLEGTPGGEEQAGD